LASVAATVTATYGGASTSTPLTVDPPSLKAISPVPNRITGGAVGSATLAFNGSMPPAGAVVSLSSSNPALAAVPATVTAPAGSFFQSVPIQTAVVSTPTDVTITATWKSVTLTNVVTLTPAVPPTSWTLDRTQTTGSQGALARVAIAAAQPTDMTYTLTSSDPTVATMNTSVTISAGSTAAGVLVTTIPPLSTPKSVTLSVSGAGVTMTVSLLVNPFPAGPLPAPALLSPADAARPAPNTPITFDWSDVAGAATYTIQVATTTAFTSTVLTSTVVPSQLVTSLAATGDRFWRVRANRPDGSAGAWSASRALRVK
jgi:hypothetical protein